MTAYWCDWCLRYHDPRRCVLRAEHGWTQEVDDAFVASWDALRQASAGKWFAHWSERMPIRPRIEQARP
jgi:hypothetical protein